MKRDDFIKRCMQLADARPAIERRYIEIKKQFDRIKNMPYSKERLQYIERIETKIEQLIIDYNNLTPLMFVDSDSGIAYDYAGNEIKSEHLREYSTEPNDYAEHIKYVQLEQDICEEVRLQRDCIEIPIATRYKGIANDLGAYISGADDSLLQQIIKTHSLPESITPPAWIGNKADASRFATWCEMRVAEFNKCFKGKRLAANNISQPKNGTITDVLDKYKK